MKKILKIRKELNGKSVEMIASVFQNKIDFAAEKTKKSRVRKFPAITVFWMFLYQVLSGNCSCNEAIIGATMTFGSTICNIANSGYCKARKRFSLEYLLSIFKRTINYFQDNVKLLWKGREVVVVDGTSIGMADTPLNQKAYPQIKNQRKGCGYPIMRITAIFSLFSGAIIDFANGKNTDSELALFRKILDNVNPCSIILGDRLYSNYPYMSLIKKNSMILCSEIKIKKENNPLQAE